jgi:hypothetical protein
MPVDTNELRALGLMVENLGGRVYELHENEFDYESLLV